MTLAVGQRVLTRVHPDSASNFSCYVTTITAVYPGALTRYIFDVAPPAHREFKELRALEEVIPLPIETTPDQLEMLQRILI